MATIRVNTAVMKDKAQSLETISKSIKNFVENMNNEVDGMKAFWEGEAADSTVKEYHRIAAGFEEIDATIKKYVSFLNKAADAYKDVDDSNQV